MARKECPRSREMESTASSQLLVEHPPLNIPVASLGPPPSMTSNLDGNRGRVHDLQTDPNDRQQFQRVPSPIGVGVRAETFAFLALQFVS